MTLEEDVRVLRVADEVERQQLQAKLISVSLNEKLTQVSKRLGGIHQRMQVEHRLAIQSLEGDRERLVQLGTLLSSIEELLSMSEQQQQPGEISVQQGGSSEEDAN